MYCIIKLLFWLAGTAQLIINFSIIFLKNTALAIDKINFVHGENLHAVDHKAEFAALFVRILLGADSQGAQTDALVIGVDDFTIFHQLHIQTVQGLFTETPNPPELGIVHADGGFSVFQ